MKLNWYFFEILERIQHTHTYTKRTQACQNKIFLYCSTSSFEFNNNVKCTVPQLTSLKRCLSKTYKYCFSLSLSFSQESTFFTFSLSSVHLPVILIKEFCISITILILSSGDFLSKSFILQEISLNYFTYRAALFESRMIP